MLEEVEPDEEIKSVFKQKFDEEMKVLFRGFYDGVDCV